MRFFSDDKTNCLNVESYIAGLDIRGLGLWGCYLGPGLNTLIFRFQGLLESASGGSMDGGLTLVAAVASSCEI